MKKLLLSPLCSLLLAGPSLAQEKPKTEPPKPPAKEAGEQGPVKQDPRKNGETPKPKSESTDPQKTGGQQSGGQQTGGQKTGGQKQGDPNKGDENGSDPKQAIKTKDADKNDGEIPEGASPDDIRAIRGSAAMKRTERRLAEVLKKMRVGGDVQYVKFEQIDAWPYQDGFKGMPKEIEKLDGKKVAMAGFMLPIDEVENIKHFYLVKSLWACCFGVPPDVNGLVKVHVKAEKGCAFQYDPILVVGTFRLKKVMDEDYCVCIYVLDDVVVRVIDID